jgi:hypothetical protein
VESRRDLLDRCFGAARLFAYPYGNRDRRVHDAVRRHGRPACPLWSGSSRDPTHRDHAGTVEFGFGSRSSWAVGSRCYGSRGLRGGAIFGSRSGECCGSSPEHCAHPATVSGRPGSGTIRISSAGGLSAGCPSRPLPLSRVHSRDPYDPIHDGGGPCRRERTGTRQRRGRCRTLGSRRRQ